MQRCTLLVICLLAPFAACESQPMKAKPRWEHPKGSRMDVLEHALDVALKFLEKELDLAQDRIDMGIELVEFLKSAQEYKPEPEPEPVGEQEPEPESGNDYSDDPIQSGGLNNEASQSGSLMQKFSRFKPTRTKDGALHMKLAQKPGEESVYKFKMDEPKQLAKNANQEDSPPPRTGDGSIKREQPLSQPGSVNPGHVIQDHTIFRQSILPNFQAGRIPISNDYGLYGGGQAKTPSSYGDYSQSGRGDTGTAAYEEVDNNYPGNDYSNDYSDDYGNDYSDDPIQSGGLKNEASGSLLEKFSKFKPTRTKDGVLHMKLAQKPGEESVYKFKVDELRQLAKTAHQVDARRR